MFASFTTNASGDPAMRRALRYSVAGVLLAWLGGALAAITFCVGALRLLFGDARAGAVTLLVAVAAGWAVRRLAGWLLRVAAQRLQQAADSAAQSGSGRIIEGEIVSPEALRGQLPKPPTAPKT